MNEAVIVEALRTPIARGKPGVGDLSGLHAAQFSALSINGVIQKADITFDDIQRVYGGCVTQAGEQSGNVTRNAWLSLGENWKTGACTIDTQCGSARAANHLISSLINDKQISVGIACGVECMSRILLGSNVAHGPGFFEPEDWPLDSTQLATP